METTREIGRSNKATEEAVDSALSEAFMSAVATGAKAMYERGVPLDVAMRVLLRPQRRRLTARLPRSI